MKTIILLYSVLFTTMSFAQVPSYVPANGLVGWWPFNGNANDESGNGNNGTVNGATLTTDRNGVANQAYSFDGNDWVTVSNSISLQNINSVTISSWVNVNLWFSNTYFPILTKTDQTSTFGKFGCYLRNNGAWSHFSNQETGFGTTYTLNTWYNTVFTMQSGIFSFYVNGQLILSGPPCCTINGFGFNNALPLIFGKDTPGITEYSNGILDDIGIWNRVLTTCEIQNLYTSQLNSTFVSAGADQTICNGQQVTLSASNSQNYSWNNGVTDSIPFYPITTQDYIVTADSANCQSSDTVTIFVNEPISSIQIETSCDSYTWNGTSYSESGVYTGTTANCVTESLNLTIIPSSTNTTTATACDSYTWNGTSYSASGTYTGATANCITESLNLTITPSSTNTTTATACDSYTWNGTTYSESGVYTGTTSNCVTESLNLTITQTFSDTTIVIACDSYTWNGTTYTESGTYTGITENCITQSLKLTINPSTSSSISQTALDSYTWLVNNQTYTTTGAYTAVIPNASGCDSTITLNLTMSFTGINDLSTSKLSVYPNPTNGDFTITGLELVGTVSSLSLTDMNGKVVKVLDTKATKFSMGSIKPGVYFLNILSGNKEEVLKIVKE